MNSNEDRHWPRFENFSKRMIEGCAVIVVGITLWNHGKPWTGSEIFLGGMIIGFLVAAIAFQLAVRWYLNG